MVALLAVLTGCGQSGGSPHAGGSSSSRPDDVALQYADDVYSMHPHDATALVLPASRNDFQVLANLMASHKLSAKGLRAGATTTTGTTAVVVLVGTICSTSRAATPSAPPPTCKTNSDAHSPDPGFQVSLTKSSDGKWYVYFPTPTSG